MSDFGKLAPDATIKKTIAALAKNGISSEAVKTKEEARQKVLSMIPKGAEVMTMSSVSLEETGITEAINESGEYDSVKKKLFSMDRKTSGRQMQKLGAAPEFALGSVHAVTEDGSLLIASNTGSQLGAYAYSSAKVIWVVGTQKIVTNVDEGMKRLHEYVVPKEDIHMHELYGVGTNVSKLLIFNKEIVPNRVHVVFVNEPLGF
ncbi:MAG TPA: LUD domain-containing protein [Candidatus Saccharimonadales bacterium]|nr:LUD domain-containing protein [Candidatus Saccharimonadales bacterium]